ncbi:unnamed protein product [Cyprideis torosa]|uniref:Disabled homolog 2-interacting protein C-terminal domain-containing protein n=1 Tax=Cyprideis torosa TaxID=163714 RepID=A0A7R8ZLH3_9CRUS|nr:unnamed protein product [Cyprideis torosa]CAG0891840.1 unnamed protein product [Cyprideis torosa]
MSLVAVQIPSSSASGGSGSRDSYYKTNSPSMYTRSLSTSSMGYSSLMSLPSHKDPPRLSTFSSPTKERIQELEGDLKNMKARLEAQEQRTKQLVAAFRIKLQEKEEMMRRAEAGREKELRGILSQMLAVEAGLKRERREVLGLLEEKERRIQDQRMEIGRLKAMNKQLLKEKLRRNGESRGNKAKGATDPQTPPPPSPPRSSLMSRRSVSDSQVVQTPSMKLVRVGTAVSFLLGRDEVPEGSHSSMEDLSCLDEDLVDPNVDSGTDEDLTAGPNVSGTTTCSAASTSVIVQTIDRLLDDQSNPSAKGNRSLNSSDSDLIRSPLKPALKKQGSPTVSVVSIELSEPRTRPVPPPRMVISSGLPPSKDGIEEFEEFKLEEDSSGISDEGSFSGSDHDRREGDGAEANHSSQSAGDAADSGPQPSTDDRNRHRNYENFLEATGLSQKSILTPSRHSNRRHSSEKPAPSLTIHHGNVAHQLRASGKDVKARNRLRALLEEPPLATSETITAIVPGPPPVHKDSNSGNEFWTGPFF